MKSITKEVKCCIKCAINKEYFHKFCTTCTMNYDNVYRVLRMLSKYKNRLRKKIK